MMLMKHHADASCRSVYEQEIRHAATAASANVISSTSGSPDESGPWLYRPIGTFFKEKKDI